MSHKGSARTFYRHESSAKKGEDWALDAITRLVESGAPLPELGKGYSKLYRAAYKVRGIAQAKLKQPLQDYQKVFWRSVSDEASSYLGKQVGEPMK